MKYKTYAEDFEADAEAEVLEEADEADWVMLNWFD